MIEQSQYLAIAWITYEDKTDYILYDFYKLKIVRLSSEAVKLISNKIINIELDNDYLDHLTVIWRFTKYSRYNEISIEEISRSFDRIKIKINNILYKEDAEQVVLFERINSTEYTLYNSVTLRLYCNGNIAELEIHNGYGVGTSEVAAFTYKLFSEDIIESNRKLFHKNIINVNNTTDLMEYVEAYDNKRLLIGKPESKMSLLDINNRIYLIYMFYDKTTDKPLILPSKATDIGVSAGDRLIDLIKTGAKGDVIVTEQQRDSLNRLMTDTNYSDEEIDFIMSMIKVRA